MKTTVCFLSLFLAFPILTFLERNVALADDDVAADLIIHHAKVIAVDSKFQIAQAIAIRNERIVAVGDDKAVLKFKGKDTKLIDAGGRTVLPGLYDSHVHPLGAATSELAEPLPNLTSLDDVFAYIRKKTKDTPEGEWIVLRFAFPTRLK
ncbi:MAG TPA: amidohydrolase family protein, partial [Gemmataceae bacterium]|nr:amidohydrolase family protein [Gemmataceae bacterium]